MTWNRARLASHVLEQPDMIYKRVQRIPSRHCSLIDTDAMVKFISTIFLVASIAVSILASPIEQRDFNTVKHDLQDTRNFVTKLDDVITGLGTLNIQQAMAIHTEVQELHKSIDKSTMDVKAIHRVSDAEGKEIFVDVQAFTPTIMHLLDSIYAKKAVFFHLSEKVVPLIRAELQSLHQAAVDLGNALTEVAPNSVKAEAKTLQKRVDAAFNRVITYYNM